MPAYGTKLLFALALLIIVTAVTGSADKNQPGAIRFDEIARQAKIDFVAENSPTGNKNQPETMLAGVAVLDYDRDGRLDLFFTNGAAIPSLEKTGPKFKNRLFHNLGNGIFEDVTDRAGVAGAGYGMGVAIGDYDNDGFPDIFLADVTSNQLLHNNRNGAFADVTARAGLAGAALDGKKMWSVGAGWFDYNNDGLLDLFVVNYCKWEVNKDPVCTTARGSRAYCHPRSYAPLPNSLFRNNGDGTFTDVSAETGVLTHRGKGMSVSFADYDHDGYMDAFVANDTEPNFLFHNLGGKRFEEAGVRAGIAFGENGTPLSSMGSDFRDVDNNGHPDIWHTAVETETFPLFLNRGRGIFLDSTLASRIGRWTVQMSGWGNGIVDLDNDGWKDLFVARSNVLDNIAESKPERKYEEPNAVLRNLGDGKFEDVSAMAGADFQTAAAHRGVAFGDLDNDGRVDAVVTVLGGRAKLFRNVSATDNHWITITLTGTRSNRMAIGAEIRLTTATGSQWNQVTTSVGYASSSDSRVHFGLGAATLIQELDIRWPSGAKQLLKNIDADRLLEITEPRE
ncbi:MAG TPA: CRTAC1 family protein [Bryobacteraceae bacterium]|jgi:hypothetical protein